MKDWLRGPTPWGVWLATCLVVGLLFAGGLIVYARVAAVTRDLQQNRVAAIEDLCLHDNANAQNNIDFLRALRVEERTLVVARRTFRQTPDCHAFAERTVRPRVGAPVP